MVSLLTQFALLPFRNYVFDVKFLDSDCLPRSGIARKGITPPPNVLHLIAVGLLSYFQGKTFVLCLFHKYIALLLAWFFITNFTLISLINYAPNSYLPSLISKLLLRTVCWFTADYFLFPPRLGKTELIQNCGGPS